MVIFVEGGGSGWEGVFEKKILVVVLVVMWCGNSKFFDKIYLLSDEVSLVYCEIFILFIVYRYI